MFISSTDAEDQLYRPQGICVDYQDNLFVADQMNDRICVFDPKSNSIQKIPCSKPRDMCLMKNRLVVVTSLDDRIDIFSN